MFQIMYNLYSALVGQPCTCVRHIHFEEEENLKKMMKEYGDIENDLKIVQGICKKEKRIIFKS